MQGQPANVDAKRPVSKPARPLPPGAWDAHSHVFGPFDRFPLPGERRYDPPFGPTEHYLAMLDRVGFERGVSVHASAYHLDLGCTADLIDRAKGRVYGTAVVPRTATETELRAVKSRGFQGIRFTSNGRTTTESPGTLLLEDLLVMAPRLKAAGLHAEVWAKCELTVAAADGLIACDLPIVFDHLGFFDASRGVNDAVFQSFLRMLPKGNFWVKLTPVRVSTNWPDYDDARPFHQAIVAAIPDRVVFGSDWPYISLDKNPPDVGHMVDLFDKWTPDAALRQKVFVDNPKALYDRKP